MNPQPRHTLERIIARKGRQICDSPKQLEALLRDLCGAYRREINILVGALEERVATDLIANSRTVPRNVLLVQLAKRLQDNLAYTPEAAHWAVDSWAVALGILTEAEFQERERQAAASDALNRSEVFNKPAPPSAPTLQNVPTPQPSPQPPPRKPPAPPSTTATKRATPQPTTRQPASSSRTQPVATPHVARSPQLRKPDSLWSLIFAKRPAAPLPQTPVAPKRSRRGLKLFGCFISIVLFVMLVVGAIFVVPAIISILHEENSRPSINDPRVK